MSRLAASLLVLGALCLWPTGAEACTYSVSNTTIDFGRTTSVPTGGLAASTTVTVQCNDLLGLLLAARVCISLPGSNRRMFLGGGSDSLGHGVYKDSGGAAPWETGSSPVALTFSTASLGTPQTVTIHGRVAGGQPAVGFGTYDSGASSIPIVVRSATALLVGLLPACSGATTPVTGPPALNAKIVMEPACTIAAADLEFGTVTTLAIPVAATTNLSATCVPGAVYTLTLNVGLHAAGSNRQMRRDSGTEMISYGLFMDAGHTSPFDDTCPAASACAGTGNGAAQVIPVYGRVPAQGPKPTGTYRDTITATITF